MTKVRSVSVCATATNTDNLNSNYQPQPIHVRLCSWPYPQSQVGNIDCHSLVMYVHTPATPPNTSLAPPSQVRYIIFRHPAYDDARNVLLKLFAPDASSSASSGIGLHAGYELAACGIVAGNRWDGWPSEHRHRHGGGDESARITFCAADRDKMLNKHSYYFHVAHDDDDTRSPYLIVPTFREWPFPHDQLPPSWTQTAPPELFEQPQIYSDSGPTTALRQHDVSCRITGYREGFKRRMCVLRQKKIGTYEAACRDIILGTPKALIIRPMPSFSAQIWILPSTSLASSSSLNPLMSNRNSLFSTCSSHLKNSNSYIIIERCKT